MKTRTILLFAALTFGATTWITGSYDPQLDLTYWGTGNAGPWNPAYRKGDSLYSAAVVAVRVRGRSFTPVLEDMVEGILVANRVRGEARPRLRLALLAAVLDAGRPSPRPASPPTLTSPTRVAERQTQAA